MPKTITIEDTSSLRMLSTGFAGAIASFLTQPLEVIKTNRINSPTIVYHELHKKIVSQGWKTYMRGSSLAVLRQAYGFTLYTQMLYRLEYTVLQLLPDVNKFYNYSFSSVLAKLTAMVFQSPLTLLKTRVQCVSSGSVLEEFKYLIKSPHKEFTKGLGSSIAREGFYTLFHYNTYRFLKDDIFRTKLQKESTFIPAFVAGVVAITVSHPFEVLRSKISLNSFNESVLEYTKNHFRSQGWRGFFTGFTARLLRKPINSGICWSVLQYFREGK